MVWSFWVAASQGQYPPRYLPSTSNKWGFQFHRTQGSYPQELEREDLQWVINPLQRKGERDKESRMAPVKVVYSRLLLQVIHQAGTWHSTAGCCTAHSCCVVTTDNLCFSTKSNQAKHLEHHNVTCQHKVGTRRNPQKKPSNQPKLQCDTAHKSCTQAVSRCLEGQSHNVPSCSLQKHHGHNVGPQKCSY
jgi:hypothetical protein